MGSQIIITNVAFDFMQIRKGEEPHYHIAKVESRKLLSHLFERRRRGLSKNLRSPFLRVRLFIWEFDFSFLTHKKPVEFELPNSVTKVTLDFFEISNATQKAHYHIICIKSNSRQLDVEPHPVITNEMNYLMYDYTDGIILHPNNQEIINTCDAFTETLLNSDIT